MNFDSIAARQYLAACSRTRITDAIGVLWALLILSEEKGSRQFETTSQEIVKLTATHSPGGNLKSLHTSKLISVRWLPHGKIGVKLSEKAVKAGSVFVGVETPAPAPDTNEIETRIIEYLNEKTGKAFRGSDKDRQLIRGRLSEGYTEEDFRSVIEVKSEQWLDDDKFRSYLRPSTLFAPSKFDSYLQESASVKPTQKLSTIFT